MHKTFTKNHDTVTFWMQKTSHIIQKKKNQTYPGNI